MASLDSVDKAAGPGIVALANSARAFDAPVRYPILYANPDIYSDLAVNLPRWAAFTVLIEHFFGFLILFPILYFRRGFSNLRKALKTFDVRDWFSLIFISAGGSALGLFFFLIALGLGNPTIAILIQNSQPLITLIFAWFLVKERPTRDFWIFLLVAIVGILFLAEPQILDSSFAINFPGLEAIFCTLLAAICWGGSTVFGRILTKKVDFWDLTLMRYAGGFSFLVVFNLLLLNYNSFNFNLLGSSVNVFGSMVPKSLINLHLSVIVILGILFVTVFTGGVVPLVLYYYGLRMSRAAIAGFAELTFPILSVFVNYIFLGYGLALIQIIGAIILLTDIAVLSYQSTNIIAIEAVELGKIPTVPD